MIDTLPPVFDNDDAVTLVFASGENFAPFCSAAILSLIDQADPKRLYDIIVLDSGMSAKSKEKYTYLTEGYDNVSIRFYYVSDILNGFQLNKNYWWQIDCYAKFLIADILPSHSKAVYLDGDIIVKDDIAKLFDIVLESISIGACRDPSSIARTANAKTNPNYEKYKRYLVDNVSIQEKNLPKYFCTATLLMNLTRIREKYSYVDFLTFAQSNNFWHLDMDIWNTCFQDDVLHIPLVWGWAPIERQDIIKMYSMAPSDLYDEYVIAGKDPKIIHFGGPDKPWKSLTRPGADDFWRVFRRTPFYAEYIEKQLSYVLHCLEEKQACLVNEHPEVLKLRNTVIELERWMHRIRFSLPYRTARKMRNLLSFKKKVESGT